LLTLLSHAVILYTGFDNTADAVTQLLRPLVWLLNEYVCKGKSVAVIVVVLFKVNSVINCSVLVLEIVPLLPVGK